MPVAGIIFSYMKLKQILLIIVTASLMSMFNSSCSTPKDISYLQGLSDGQAQALASQRRLTVRPDDRLSIIVSSKDPELAQAFNLMVAQSRLGQTGTSTNNSQTSAYTVSPEGEISMPLVGTIEAAGLTRSELARQIESRIKAEGLLKDPVVTVEFLNAAISVLGDVESPGEYPIDRDNMTLLQALSKAGDLKITGQRRNVMVLRQEGDKEVSYFVDLTNPKSVMESPAYHIQQNDVIYVEPNNMRKRQSTINGTSVLTPGFWISIASFVASMSVLIFK